ncbi:hypothetical protein TRFO_19808 [Tritrichomonas foetus]|uniref:Uncharacterized protein n=1 Tax=Tritrichomonas foetus TaxID=1144522 RepID=A0A1J4KHJ0_9EUKA|nr:hypothetical protein TRFO_19808 [Tritrichomonas foetus]|eukprot:OHT10825.1 hypothetical protein TRFO_19808 [Tritrichomonas foetus]
MKSEMRGNTRLTYEQSLDKIQQLRDAIDEATENRDYNRAKHLQYYLHKHEMTHAKLFIQNKENIIQKQIAALESEKLEKEAKIVQYVINTLNEVYSMYDKNYSDLERRHFINIENLRSQFSQPRFTNVRFSTNVKYLQNAEKYYASKQDFLTAGQIKKQLEYLTKKETEEFEISIRGTIEAKIRDAENHYQMQQATFSQRLINERNNLKKEVKKKILGLDNHYKKLIHNITRKNEKEIDTTSSFEKQIMENIDYEFNQYAIKLENQYSNLLDRNYYANQMIEKSYHENYQPKAKKMSKKPKEPKEPPSEKSVSRRITFRCATSNAKQSNRNPRVDFALKRQNKGINIAEHLNNS